MKTKFTRKENKQVNRICRLILAFCSLTLHNVGTDESRNALRSLVSTNDWKKLFENEDWLECIKSVKKEKVDIMIKATISVLEKFFKDEMDAIVVTEEDVGSLSLSKSA